MSAGFLRAGFLADGAWKILVGIAMLVLRGVLVERYDAPSPLLVVTAVVVMACGLAEALYAVRDGAGSRVPLLIAYDSGWVLVSVVALLLARTAAGPAWRLWLGYQLVVAIVVGTLFALACRKRPAPPLDHDRTP